MANDATGGLTPLGRLLRPASIAIVGSLSEPLSIGSNALANLDRFGYAGDVHLVSRKGGRVADRDCLSSVEELPLGVDAAILAVSASAVHDTLAACARRQVGGAVVFASGFGEQDEAGGRAQDEIVALARREGLGIIGPNCVGFVNYADRAPLTFEPVDPIALAGPGVCVIAQSGAMAGNIRYALQGRGVPVSHSISTGNEAAAGTEDFIDLLLDDPRVALFAIFVEQIRRPQNFLGLCRRANALGKRIVVLHSGRSLRAREAAKTHTGALAGDYAVMRAFVERAGAILVDGMDVLFDVCALLAVHPDPFAGGLGIVSNSGALRGVGLDLAEELDLPVPAFAPATTTGLKSVLPSFAVVENPLDITAAAMTSPSLFGEAARAIVADPGIGALLVVAIGGGRPQQRSKWRALEPALAGARKPVAVCYLGDEYPLDDEFLTEVRASGVPFFRSPERAIRAFAHLARWSGRVRGARPATPLSAPATLNLPGPGPLAEWRSKEVLAEIGVPVPPGRLVDTLEAARAAAAELGFPLALKAQADALPHKSDVGGVILGIADPAALEEGYERLVDTIARARPDIVLDGVLVEAMAPANGVEMIVGARRDPHWGPILAVGLGGVWAEALADVRLLPADAGLDEIVVELDRLNGAALLRAWRGSPPRDVRALAALAVQISGLMRANPRIQEIDLNPVNVYANGHGVMALDALIVTG